ncbi:MAG: hypothetical protein ACJZ40_07100 [Candidatus Poseidoniaceae archaeon]
MKSQKRQSAVRNGPIRVCCALVVLMIATGLSPMVTNAEMPSWSSEEQNHGTDLIEFFPAQNTTSVLSSIDDALVFDANRTLTGGRLTVEPLWSSSDANGTNYGVSSTNQWNGTHLNTNGIGHGGQLTLATEASLGTITDFESTVRTASGWMGVGDDHEAWVIVQPHIDPLTTQSGMLLPINGSGTNAPPLTASTPSALSTRGEGDLLANMTGCIRSPSYETPNFINNYTLYFDHWLALNSDDAAWVEIKTSLGAWAPIPPIDAYNATSSNPIAPSSVWNGASPEWTNATFLLDPYVSSLQDSIEVKFCYATGTSQAPRGGWFVDEVVLNNQGDNPGAWFHGNLSGNYLPNAGGQLALSLDFSNQTGQTVELEISSNWDIEGGTRDHLTAWISFDNGSSFSPISNHPGHPNNGALCNGVFFNGPDSSNAWCPVMYSLPWNTIAPQNVSNVLLRFWVQTNANNNFGGTASSGWEGVFIDDVSVWLNRGTASQSKTVLANFTTQPSLNNGSADGWLTYDGSAPNEWQWTQAFGNNGQTLATEGFETNFQLPAGWSLDAVSNRRWDVGVTSNSSGFGPGVWHSGTNGAGIYLDDEYRNNMLTHLYTPEYSLPENSTARLTFRSWVCTESSWDGGAVSISTDGGESWWFLPPTLNGFHDQISTVNSNSPLFGEGIFDGSQVVGGCHNVQRGFDLKTFDLSNLSGSDVRARFTFFSDQLIELDGWYIDDAGIEIDVYEPSGTWVSDPIHPNPHFGWGSVDGFVSEPSNTSIRFDVLDANGTVLVGYENRTLPIDLAFDQDHHLSLSIRAHLTTNDPLLTPSLARLNIGSVGYYDAYHHRNAPYPGVGLSNLNIDSDGLLTASSAASLIWDFESVCPFQTFIVESYGDNLSATHSGFALEAWTYAPLEPPVLHRTLTKSTTPVFETEIALSWVGGDASQGFTFEPRCALEPRAPHITLGNENTTLFEWPASSAGSSFGLTRGLYAVNGTQSGLNAATNGSVELVQNGTQSAHLSWYLPISDPYTPASLSYTMQVLVEMTGNSTSGAIEFQQGGPTLTLSSNQSVRQDRITHDAVCVPAPEPGQANLALCHFPMTMSGNFSVQFSQAVFIPAHQHIVNSLPQQLLNQVASNFTATNASSTVVLPLYATTGTGSIEVNLSATTQPALVDKISPIAHVRWLPGQTVVFETQHWRGDANQPSLDAPDFTKVEFMLSPTKYQSDAVVHLEVIDVDSTPQFRQLAGVAYAHLISQNSSVSCSMNVCNVTWSLTSTWAFDDIDDVHALAFGTDVDGLSTGPAHLHRQTGFNEIENDLEVVDFSLMDANQRNLNDWSNPQWPFHLSANQTMQASGAVRFQGIAQAYVAQGQAEVRIDAVAVPPINQSGGPNEWPSDQVEWTASWFSEVDANGHFSVMLSTPSEDAGVPSGTRILVSPHIERRGPSDVVATTSLDFTSRSNDVPFLFDRVAPNTISLLALDPGGYAPADNHIWMKGQDVALRVTLEDEEGLANSLLLHTWLESRDDSNLDGQMDADEYVVQTVSFNLGLTEAVIDLPLLPWLDITGGASSGKASVVIEAFDLAGNMLEGGGTFGESQDLGTVFVQERYDALIETSSLQFDALNGKLLLGHEHTFAFTITDGNGITSLDELELALLGRDQSNMCFIEYKPRTEQIFYDLECFEFAPTVSVAQQGLQQMWSVSISFRLAWSFDSSSLTEAAIPSLKVFDEGQDLGLGLSKISIFAWHVSSQLEVSFIQFEDLTSPIGSVVGHHFWLHRNDELNLTIALRHVNTNVLAEFIPERITAQIVLSDGERSIGSNISFDDAGFGNSVLTLNDTVVKHNSGFIDVIVQDSLVLHDERFNFSIDRFSPQLTVPPGTLGIVDSDRLDDQDIIVIVSDQEGLGNASMNIHWHFLRLGQVLEGSTGSSAVERSAGSGTTNTYSGTIDMRPSESVTLERTDRLEVWFSGSDLAGRDLSGFGTEEAPMTPTFRWVAFEPRFDDIVVTPYRPSVGENITIFVRIANEGLVNGSTTVHLIDADGRILERNTSHLEPGTWVEHNWSVETWTTGRLGLSVKLVDVTGNIPLPMGEVQSRQDATSGGLDAIGFAALVVILAAGVLGFSIYRRREAMAEFTQKQVDAALFERSAPPPRPKDLDDLDEEQ